MTAVDALRQAEAHGVRVWAVGDRLRYMPKDAPRDLVDILRQHKPELLALLNKPFDSAQDKPAVVDAPTEWHAQEIERRVEAEGVCVFWADVLGALVAFVQDEAHLARVPAGVVAFTSAELANLFPDHGECVAASTLRLLYEAKRLGGNGATAREDGEPRGQG